jgi:hypothetical protein
MIWRRRCHRVCAPAAVAALVGVVPLLTFGCGPSPPSSVQYPVHVTASGWNTFAVVRWQPPPDGGPVATYRVVASPGDHEAVVPGRQTWADVDGLRNHTRYRFTVTAVSPSTRRSSSSATSNAIKPLPVAIHVRHNQLVNAAGQAIRLIGVNRSGTEYSCVDGSHSIFSGPADQASIATMASWHINAVRLPLNEDCWLGINGVDPTSGGPAYQAAITSYVDELHAAGMVVILDLHWAAPGTQLSNYQNVMADADHAPRFWASVATWFKRDRGVMFDLYNEPADVTWDCWRSGCLTSSGWRAAGMQALIDDVRATGAKQPILAGGLSYAEDLSGWRSHPLYDPAHQLAASVHVYNEGPGSGCHAVGCWDRTIPGVAAATPVVTTELGDFGGGDEFMSTYVQWVEARPSLSISVIGWSWDAALGEGGPSLITSYDGTPTPFGSGVKAYFQSLFERGELRQG